MNQHVVDGRTITICPQCKRDISGRVLIIYYPTDDGGERSVWRCRDAGENGRANRPRSETGSISSRALGEAPQNGSGPGVRLKEPR